MTHPLTVKCEEKLVMSITTDTNRSALGIQLKREYVAENQKINAQSIKVYDKSEKQ